MAKEMAVLFGVCLGSWGPSRLVMGIIGVSIWLTGFMNLLAKSPWPSK